MNPYYHSYSRYPGFADSLTESVKVLIIINVILFILVHLSPQFAWLRLFGLVPNALFARFRLWQLVSYMFLHAGLGHLVVNMLMLWFFGPAIERAWGSRQFLFYYFFTGIGAGLCSWIMALRSAIPVIGASGAIFGILVAYALLYPETVILLFFIFPMKIKHAVLLLAGINLLGALSTAHAGIAYFAHLGGGLFGYLYLKQEWLRRKLLYLSYWTPRKLTNWRSRRRATRRRSQSQDLDQQVDAMLDKVSRHGLASLSRKERKILELKSKRGVSD